MSHIDTSKASEKRIRQADKRHTKNVSAKSNLKTISKKAGEAIEQGNSEKAAPLVHAAIIAIDKNAGKGIIHKNKAARKKSRMTKKLNKLSKS